MRRQDIFASTQIISFNPILKYSNSEKINYFLYLKKIIKLVKFEKNRYSRAQLKFYEKRLLNDLKTSTIKKQLDKSFCYLLPFDIAFILGLHRKKCVDNKINIIIETVCNDFKLNRAEKDIIGKEFDAIYGNLSAWSELELLKQLNGKKKYLRKVKENIQFIERKPYNILITATMSAGKSTLTNALIGKKINLTQNMACTSKIHIIVSKKYEDNVVSEYDHKISLDATNEELMCDDVDNKTSKIIVGTYFNGGLGGKRIVFFDSPGVNSSENPEHKLITEKMVKSRNYNLMFYILNATQLSTTDDEKHLEEVAKKLGRCNILFIMNKIDYLLSEDENIHKIIERQKEFLISKGFKNPIICPVSSKAAFLARKSENEELSRIEKREIENYIDKFEQYSLKEYYENVLGCKRLRSEKNEVNQLKINCGFAYLENIIDYLYNGGKLNGTDIR